MGLNESQFFRAVQEVLPATTTTTTTNSNRMVIETASSMENFLDMLRTANMSCN